MQADGGAIYPVDLLAIAVLHRSTNLIRGFAMLVKQRNFISAAPLLRLQIDNCLRFYAVYLVKDPHEFAKNVFKGVHISKMTDKSGKSLTDSHLAKRLSELHPWVKRVYERTSAYVHLSSTHIFNTFAPTTPEKQKERIQKLVFGRGDCFPTDELYEEATEAFIAATDVLFKYLVGWVETKSSPPKASIR